MTDQGIIQNELDMQRLREEDETREEQFERERRHGPIPDEPIEWQDERIRRRQREMGRV